MLDGRIEIVGDDDDVRDRIGRGTDVIDLAGRMLLPGFQDAHVHPPSSGVEMLRCDLTGSRGLAAYERAIGEYARAHPDLPWVIGGGWSMGDFPGGNPPKTVLDRLVPDRPALPAEPRRPQRVGQHPGPRPSPASRGRPPIRRTA